MAKPKNKIRMCTDFGDLDKASLKDVFSLPNIDMRVDSTIGHVSLSFIDGFLGYNQIFINRKDQFKISFTTPWGMLCWVMMCFRLKNIGTTYQCDTTLIFHDYMHKILEDYVDDILALSLYLVKAMLILFVKSSKEFVNTTWCA